MSTPYTDQELDEMFSDGHKHRMISPGETLTVMVPHKDVTEQPTTDHEACQQADYVLIYFDGEVPLWRRVTYKGRKTIKGINGPFEIADFDYGETA